MNNTFALYAARLAILLQSWNTCMMTGVLIAKEKLSLRQKTLKSRI
jgi:hypothetical protein